MAPKRPAKISTTAKGSMYAKTCPKCGAKIKKLVKMIRHSKPSGMFWVCDCGFEGSVNEMK